MLTAGLTEAKQGLSPAGLLEASFPAELMDDKMQGQEEGRRRASPARLSGRLQFYVASLTRFSLRLLKYLVLFGLVIISNMTTRLLLSVCIVRPNSLLMFKFLSNFTLNKPPPYLIVSQQSFRFNS